MTNLIENAIKYTPDGGSIWVNARGDGDKILINVTDTGIGIAAEDLGHIFQKFYRADNSETRVVGGTGLGLYLVKKRAEAMGGRAWAESAFGEGSTFYISLPRISEEEYEKRMIVYRNQQAVQAFSERPLAEQAAERQVMQGRAEQALGTMTQPATMTTAVQPTVATAAQMAAPSVQSMMPPVRPVMTQQPVQQMSSQQPAQQMATQQMPMPPQQPTIQQMPVAPQPIMQQPVVQPPVASQTVIPQPIVQQNNQPSLGKEN